MNQNVIMARETINHVRILCCFVLFRLNFRATLRRRCMLSRQLYVFMTLLSSTIARSDESLFSVSHRHVYDNDFKAAENILHDSPSTVAAGFYYSNLSE